MYNNELNHSYYSFYTKYTLLDDYGFSSGLINRVFKKILPAVPDEETFEFFLLKNKRDIDVILDSFDFTTIERSNIANELDTSIKALCSKIVAFGLDNNIHAKFKQLELETLPFETLLTEIIHLENCDSSKINNFILLLETIENNIHALRKYKKKIGVNLHLTMVTRRIIDYINRVKELIGLKSNLKSRAHWEEMIKNHLQYLKRKDSIRKFIISHLDLLIFEIVEHTSSRGEHYIAETQKEYWQFFYKSMLGGALIAVFALLKIYLDSYSFSPMANALIFSLNYAVCFILVKQIGGIIATKQPAMTASTIAKHIDHNNNLEIDSIKEVVALIKKAISSQFISIVGNFIMALIVACAIFKLFEMAGWEKNLGIKPDYLVKGVMPGINLISYAAIAGLFLALSGLISGFIDNKIIASKFAYRITHSKRFPLSKALANFVTKKGGVFIGNLSLGFFLGSAFLLSGFMPFPVDIRHIAFSSSNFAYAIMSQPFESYFLLKALLGIVIIGFTNLIVSFSITLLLALKSRGAKFSLIPGLLIYSVKDFVSHPLEYFYFNENIEKHI